MNDNSKVCVVSLIGRSQMLKNQTKAWKLNALLKKNFFKADFGTKSDLTASENYYNDLLKKASTEKSDNSSEESKKTLNNEETENEPDDDEDTDFKIQTCLDAKNRIIYVHLESFYDTVNMFETLDKNANSPNPKSFVSLWEREQTKYVKSVLLLFSISHIIILSSPSCEFENGYIRFFRIIDTLRNKLLPSMVDLLKSLDLPISKDWLYAGRPCSPRVLFTFENCHLASVNDATNIDDKAFEKLQHFLEDQIYNNLRKSYIITNISNNSLFAIPANQEFVYVHRLTTDLIDTNRFLYLHLSNDTSLASAKIEQTLELVSLDDTLFRKFIFDHVKKALSEGFNDNIGRTNVQPVFELPKVSVWYKLFDGLVNFFLKNPKSKKVLNHYAQLKVQIDIDGQFSENRCKKILPSAIALYKENLPAYYTKAQHQQALDKAIHLYANHARGPLYKTYLEQLKKECTSIWQNGRQLCEAISLTGHGCMHEVHILPNETNINDSENETKITEDLDKEDDDNESTKRDISRSRFSSNVKGISIIKNRDLVRNSSSTSRRALNEEVIVKNKKITIKSHSSNLVSRGASNCGEAQRERKDPFDLKEANYNFYEDFNKLELITKKNLVKYDFEVANNNKKIILQRNIDKPIDSTSTDQQQKQLISSSRVLNSENVDVNPISSTDNPSQQINPVLNPDTSLYRMNHSENKLLPISNFNSWSLLSIGKYSDYNVHAGLNQPGFLSNNNYLVPWDIYVNKDTLATVSFKSSSRKNTDSQKGDTSSKSESVHVVAYIGFDYECPLGHRFICSGPDRVVKISPNGTVKDDGYKLLNCDMPLYTACPCRVKESPYMAQCMRVYIATPPENVLSKSNESTISSKRNISPASLKNNQESSHQARLNIFLKPRVQPNPQSPIFWPCQEPILLKGNNIWVLRLPYIYMNDDGQPYYKPKDFETLRQTLILKGILSAEMQIPQENL